MSGLVYLIPIALALGGLGLAAFIWALRNGQFDDLDGAASRILFDDDPPRQAPKSAIAVEPQFRAILYRLSAKAVIIPPQWSL